MEHYKAIVWLAIIASSALPAYASPSTTASPTETLVAPSAAKPKAPVLLHEVSPYYPPIAQYEGVEGSVQVCFTVETDGELANIHIGKSKFWTHGEPAIRGNGVQKSLKRASKRSLKAEAVYTLTQWKYKPGYKNGLVRLPERQGAGQ